MLRVEQMKLTGIGPFEEAEFNFPAPEGERGLLVLFEGPNGSGKSTVAGAIALAFGMSQQDADYREIDLRNVLNGTFSGFAQKIRTGSHSISALLSRDADRGRLVVRNYRITKPTDKVIRFVLFDDSFLHTAQGHQSSPVLDNLGPRDLPSIEVASALTFGARSSGPYFGQFLTNVESDRVRAKVYATELPDEAKRALMKERAESLRCSIQRIEIALSTLLDRVVKISFPIEQHAPHITFDGEDIPLDQLGEGLRSSFAWMADLLVRLERHPWADTSVAPTEQPFTLILDEVDEGLHPAMQMRLMPTLRSLFPRANIYATTHSPFVVASAGSGVVFPLRPGQDHRVRGEVKAVPLTPGQSLSWVVEEVFRVPSEFIDPKTRNALELHRASVDRIQSGREVDWAAFRDARDFLLGLNEETRSIVTFRELPARDAIHRGLLAITKPAA